VTLVTLRVIRGPPAVDFEVSGANIAFVDAQFALFALSNVTAGESNRFYTFADVWHLEDGDTEPPAAHVRFWSYCGVSSSAAELLRACAGTRSGLHASRGWSDAPKRRGVRLNWNNAD
jgi:hypothetical protein